MLAGALLRLMVIYGQKPTSKNPNLPRVATSLEGTVPAILRRTILLMQQTDEDKIML